MSRRLRRKKPQLLAGINGSKFRKWDETQQKSVTSNRCYYYERKFATWQMINKISSKLHCGVSNNN